MTLVVRSAVASDQGGSMRAVVIDDGDLRVDERPDPVPGPTEVVVSVASAGLNGADILQRRGLYPAPAGAPVDIPGLEFSGVVAALGADVRGVTVGDRVMGIVAGGAQATMVAVDARHLLHVPDHVSLLDAGGFAEAATTAYDALVTQAHLSAGDRVLITGAAGGVGTAAVQLAHALGAQVIASVRSPAQHGAVAALGADEVLAPDAAAVHGPFDVVLELVGAPSLEATLGSLNIGARIAVVGVGAGAKAQVNLLALMGARAQISGATLRARGAEEKAAIAAAMQCDVVPLLAAGALTVPVVATFGLADVRSAYDRFTAGGKLGKVLLVCDEELSRR